MPPPRSERRSPWIVRQQHVAPMRARALAHPTRDARDRRSPVPTTPSKDTGSALDAVHRPAGRLPRVVRGARTEPRLVADDRGFRPTSFARCACQRRFGSSRSSHTSTRCAAVMKSATNEQPSAGQGTDPSARRTNRRGRRRRRPPRAPRPSRGRRRRARCTGRTFELHGGTIASCPRPTPRDVAVVLSGGGINGVLLELGFLRRLAETRPLAARRLDLRHVRRRARGDDGRARPPRRPRGVPPRAPAGGRLPTARDLAVPGGLHDYTLPATIATASGRLRSSAPRSPRPRSSSSSTRPTSASTPRTTRRATSSSSTRRTRPSPRRWGARSSRRPRSAGSCFRSALDGRIATDGGWVRNFPFEHAYRNPEVAAIAAFRYVPSYQPTDAAFLERTRERLERFRAVPPVRALLAEVRLAQERRPRGEPAHYGELIVRLMRVAFARNAVRRGAARPGARDVGRRSCTPPRGGHRRAVAAAPLGASDASAPSWTRASKPRASRSATTATSPR